MTEETTVNPTGTRLYNAMAMSQDWIGRSAITGLATSTVLGALLNIYFLSSFITHRPLMRIGNTFLVCAGASDLLLTAVVIPAACVVFATGRWDVLLSCRSLQLLITASTYCYSMYFTLASVETYSRVCHSVVLHVRDSCILESIVATCSIVFIIAFGLASLGVYGKHDYDYCEREYTGDLFFRYTTFGVFHGTTLLLSGFCLLAAYTHIEQINNQRSRHRQSALYYHDGAMVRVNMASYFVYVAGWLTHVIILNYYPNTSDQTFYHAAAVGVTRAIPTSLIYGCCNGALSTSYFHLFKYCFCRVPLPDNTRRHRNPATRSRCARPIDMEMRPYTCNDVVLENCPPVQIHVPITQDDDDMPQMDVDIDFSDSMTQIDADIDFCDPMPQMFDAMIQETIL